MLRRCPNHGFEEIAQLNIFHNGLRPDTKMILDAAAGGMMMAVDVEQDTGLLMHWHQRTIKHNMIVAMCRRKEF